MGMEFARQGLPDISDISLGPPPLELENRHLSEVGPTALISYNTFLELPCPIVTALCNLVSSLQATAFHVMLLSKGSTSSS